jgi:hypothetical protein
MDTSTAEKIEMIIRQTSYTDEVAKSKLEEFDGNLEMVVRNFYGLDEPKKSQPLKTYNQEIYAQIRKKLQNVSNNVSI